MSLINKALRKAQLDRTPPKRPEAPSQKAVPQVQRAVVETRPQLVLFIGLGFAFAVLVGLGSSASPCSSSAKPQQHRKL